MANESGEGPRTTDPADLPTIRDDTESAPRPRLEVGPGMVLFGAYRVESKLGEGGMGSVWHVRNIDLDTPRALKLIVTSAADDPDARARFLREARAMARLSHPGVVAVHRVQHSGDCAFIEMDYVRGASLGALLRPGVPMPADWVARFADQMCDVLQSAHDVGIVHRDLKPSNLMFVDGPAPGRERLKVLDFGIAKILGEGESALAATAAGMFMGTASYASPEQIDPDAPLVRKMMNAIRPPMTCNPWKPVVRKNTEP